MKNLELIAYRISRTAVFTLSNLDELKSKQSENIKPLVYLSEYRKNFNQSKHLTLDKLKQLYLQRWVIFYNRLCFSSSVKVLFSCVEY